MRSGVRIAFGLCLGFALFWPAAATAGLVTNTAVTNQIDNFLSPAYCNGGLFSFNLVSLPLNSAACTTTNTSGGGSANLATNARAWATYGMVGANIGVSASGNSSALLEGVAANASASFSDAPYLDVAGLNQDDPVLVTFLFTVTGSKSISNSSIFTGAYAPLNVHQELHLNLGQDGGGNSTSTYVPGFTAGTYSVAYTLLNRESFYSGVSLYLEYELPQLPAGQGSFSANDSMDFFGTVHLTQINVSSGGNPLSTFSITGGNAGTNYNNVLTAPSPFAPAVPEPSTAGLLGGALILVWFGGRRRR